jgi:hypothetical protein
MRPVHAIYQQNNQNNQLHFFSGSLHSASIKGQRGLIMSFNFVIFYIKDINMETGFTMTITPDEFKQMVREAVLETMTVV